MRLEDWYKRVQSFEILTKEIATGEPVVDTESSVTTKADENDVAGNDSPFAGMSGSVQVLPNDSATTPTVVASSAAETLPEAAQKFAQNAGVTDATFRTASAPKAETKTPRHKGGRAVGDDSLDLFAQPSKTPPPPAAPVSRESREELMARLLDPILTLEEAAQLLGVCPTTVRRWTNKGVLQHYRTSGNQRRFRLSHVVGFLGDDGGPTKPRRSGTLSHTHEESRPLLTLSSQQKDGVDHSGRGLQASHSA